MNTVVSSSFFFLTAFLICTTTAQDPCNTFEQIPDIEKRDGNYHIMTGQSYLSDMFMTKKWYGDKVSARTLLESAPGFQRCGTLFPVWRKSKSSGISHMCVQFFSSMPCFMQFTIPTRQCGQREIYQLSPTYIYRSAYCFGADASTPPVFNNKPTVEFQMVQNGLQSGLKFSCNFVKHSQDVFYSIIWSVDDIEITTSGSEQWNGGSTIINQALTESHLRSKNINVYGIQIACKVRVSYGIDSPSSTPLSSEWKFVGIKVSPTSVVLEQGQEAEITLQLTAPFSCGPLPGCFLIIAVSTIDNPQECDEVAVYSSSCGARIHSSNWNTPVAVRVRGGITSTYGLSSRILKIKLTTLTFPLHGMWSNYDLGFVTVQLSKDTQLIEQKSCYSTNDPHMKTFDGRRYEHQYDGTFTMYKHNELPLEVQIRTSKCSQSRNAWCNCGVAVRAGGTVFEFNKCDGQSDIWLLDYTLCDDGNDVLQVKRKGSEYEVYLPTGGKMKVTVYGKYMNVYIYPSVQDVKNSSGLCGYLSEACNDDFVMRDGSYSTDPTSTNNCDERSDVWVNLLTTFSESWRVEPENSLFNSHLALERWPVKNTFCTCLTSGVDDHSTEVDCSATKGIKSCNKIPGFQNLLPSDCSVKDRRRRSATRVPETPNREKRQTGTSWTNGWTAQKAKDYCDQLFKNSKSVTVCDTVKGVNTSESIDNCMLDILLTGGTEFGPHSLDEVRSKCLHEVAVNPSLQTDYDHVIAVACPNDCSQHGICNKGNCRCFTNFGGEDCSVDISKPPVLTAIAHDGHCDISQYSCDNITLYGETFAENATCRVTEYKVSHDRFIPQGTVIVDAHVRSNSHVQCNIARSLPKRKKRALDYSFQGEYVLGYEISVSNNNKSFSNALELGLYDQTCIVATVNGKASNWAIKGPFCVNEGRCFEDGWCTPRYWTQVCNGTSQSWNTGGPCK